MTRSRYILGLALMLGAVTFRPDAAAAQQRGDTGTRIVAARSMVTRAELQAALDDIQKNLGSSGYSQALRATKQAEADAIKERLSPEGGDLRPGDDIKVSVLNVGGLSRTYTVTPSRTIVLPNGKEIPMKGVLRSEVQQYLTDQIGQLVVNPTVSASATVRVSIFGTGKPGFYNVPADELLSIALQTEGGGVPNNFRDDKSQILRNGVVVIDGPEFKDAIYRGRTLDQLNVQAGDEIRVATKPATGLFWRIVGGISALGGLIYLVIQVTR